MHDVQEKQGESGLLSAEQVEAMLGVDKSTIYRMAGDGRLAAIKIGRQWRFPAAAIHELLNGAAPAYPLPVPPLPRVRQERRDATQPVIDLAAQLLGVMMVATDMDGNPITEVANACRWFEQHGSEPGVLEACIEDWRALAAEHDWESHFQLGPHGYECARALIRDGNHLVGMVLAGGVAPGTSGDPSDGFYHLDEAGRRAVLDALPRVAATISRVSPRPSPQRRSAS